jgi:hypothetical protein
MEPTASSCRSCVDRVKRRISAGMKIRVPPLSASASFILSQASVRTARTVTASSRRPITCGHRASRPVARRGTYAADPRSTPTVEVRMPSPSLELGMGRRPAPGLISKVATGSLSERAVARARRSASGRSTKCRRKRPPACSATARTAQRSADSALDRWKESGEGPTYGGPTRWRCSGKSSSDFDRPSGSDS